MLRFAIISVAIFLLIGYAAGNLAVNYVQTFLTGMGVS